MYGDQKDPRRFDLPSGEQDYDVYEETPMDKAKEAGEKAFEIVKSKKKLIIGVLILLIIGFFAYDFFIGSIKQASFTVNDTEGNEIAASTIRVTGPDGKTIKTVSSGQSIELRKGNYAYSVTSSGYKLVQNKPLEVTENTEITETLEKNVDIELVLVDEFPQKLVEGQTATMIISLKNNSQAEFNAELVFEDAIGSDTMSISYEKPVPLFPELERQVTLSIEVKSDLKDSQIKEGLSGTIRVKGLNNPSAKKSVSFDLTQFEQDDIRITGSTSFGTIIEGDPTDDQLIRIKNQTDFDIENLDIEILQINSQSFDQEAVKNWFSYSRPLPIPVIKAGTEETIGIRVYVPVGLNFAQNVSQENIGGTIVFKTSFFEKRLNLDITVKKNETELSMTGVSNKTVTKDNEGSYPTQTFNIRIENEGSLEIKNVLLTAACNENPQVYFSFSEDFIDPLAAGEEITKILTIDVSSNIEEDNVFTCAVSASHDNPRKGEPFTITKKQDFTITTK